MAQRIPIKSLRKNGEEEETEDLYTYNHLLKEMREMHFDLHSNITQMHHDIRHKGLG